MRLQRHRQEVKVRRIAQQVLMNAEIFRHCTVGTHPDLTFRFCSVAFHRVMEFNGADLKRLIAEELLLYLRRKQMRQRPGDIGFRFEIVRRRGWRHHFLMLIARFRRLERGGHVKDRFAMLNGCHAASTKTVAISQHFNVIDNGFCAIARAQEVTVKGVHQTVSRDGFLGCVQRLSHDLPTEDLA